MQSNHRTQFLFIHPDNPPSELPMEDEITEKVDFIFSHLKEGQGYRGMHITPFGVASGTHDYIHDELPIVSNSLAPYYIRHHRADISEKEIAWIHELFAIVNNPKYYTFKRRAIYYFKLYEKGEHGYGDVMTYAVKAIGRKKGIQQLLSNTFFKELTKLEFEEAIKYHKGKYQHSIEGCSSIEVYDVLKQGSLKNW